MVVDPMDVKVLVKFGDSRSKYSRDIRLPHFVRDAGRWTDSMIIQVQTDEYKTYNK